MSRSHVTLVSWSVQLPPASELPDPNTKQSECRAECRTLKTLQRKVLIPEALQNMEIKDQGAQMEPLLPTVRDNLLSQINRVCCRTCQASGPLARCSDRTFGVVDSSHDIWTGVSSHLGWLKCITQSTWFFSPFFSIWMHYGDEMSHVCCCLKRWLGFSSRGSCVSLFLPVSAYLCFSGCAVVAEDPAKKPPASFFFFFLSYSIHVKFPLCAWSPGREVRESAAVAAAEI